VCFRKEKKENEMKELKIFIVLGFLFSIHPKKCKKKNGVQFSGAQNVKKEKITIEVTVKFFFIFIHQITTQC
jgi:hypothetical protein